MSKEALVRLREEYEAACVAETVAQDRMEAAHAEEVKTLAAYKAACERRGWAYGAWREELDKITRAVPA